MKNILKRKGYLSKGAVAFAAMLMAGSLAACSSGTGGSSANNNSGSDDSSSSSTAEKVLIRYSTGGAMPPNEMEVAIFNGELEDAGILKNLGTVYDFDMTFAKGTPEAQTLLISGEVDFATLAFSTIATTHLQNAIPDGFSVVAGHFIDGMPNQFSNTYLALDSSGINTVNDLKGKTIAVNSIGSAVDVVLRANLIDNGIDPEKDVEFVEIGFGAMGQALRDGRADMAAMVQPFHSLEMAEGGVHVVTTAAESVGLNSAIALVVRNDFLKKHPEATKAFLADWVAGLNYLDDPANRDEAIAIISGVSKTDVSALELFYGTENDYYRDSNGCPSPEALQNGVDAMFKVGYLKDTVDIASLTDFSFLPNPAECGK